MIFLMVPPPRRGGGGLLSVIDLSGAEFNPAPGAWGRYSIVRPLVSGTNSMPTTKVTAAITIGYHRPE